jgi:hypothetical protein
MTFEDFLSFFDEIELCHVSPNGFEDDQPISDEENEGHKNEWVANNCEA